MHKKQVRPKLEKRSSRMVIKKRKQPLTLMLQKRNMKLVQKVKLMLPKLRPKLIPKHPLRRIKMMKKIRTPLTLLPLQLTKKIKKTERRKKILQKRPRIKPVLNKKLLRLKALLQENNMKKN